jgi:hypothetical protein
VSQFSARLTFANVVSVVALFVALGGSATAALLVTGKNVKDASLTGADVKNNSVGSVDIKDGNLLATDFKPGQLPAGGQGPTGDTGPKGDAGPKGDSGPQGAQGTAGSNGADGVSVASGSESPGAHCTYGGSVFTGASGQTYACNGSPGQTGIVATARVSGAIGSSVSASASTWIFIGPTAFVATSSGQRLTGVVMVPIGATAATTADLDLCFQSGAGALTNFAGNSNYSTIQVGTVRVAHVAAGSTVPGAGTYNVGACARPAGTLNNNDYVNGHIQVTN